MRRALCVLITLSADRRDVFVSKGDEVDTQVYSRLYLTSACLRTEFSVLDCCLASFCNKFIKDFVTLAVETKKLCQLHAILTT